MPASVPIEKVELYLTAETRDAAQNLEMLIRRKELDYNAGLLKE